LDREVLEPGEEAYAQLRLEEETVAKRGDRFILRFYSPMFTVGGGEVLEPNPSKRKRFDEDSLEELTIKDQGDLSDIIEHIVEEGSKSFLSLKEISKTASMLEATLEDETRKLENEGKIVSFRLSKDIYPIHNNILLGLEDKIKNELEIFHVRYPIRNGIAKEELRSRFLSKAKPRLAEEILDHIVVGGSIRQNRDIISLSGFEPKLNDKQESLKRWILESFEKAGFMPPKQEDLYKSSLGSNEETDELLTYLIGSGELTKISEELYLLPSSLVKARNALDDLMKEAGSISVGGYRDILGTNRKVAIGILEYFDQLKVTRRSGENRVLYK
jgi:selenocysteine-specific elongation factor